MQAQLKFWTAVMCVTLAVPAATAPIQWTPAFEIVSDADIRIAGREVVYAINGGDNTGNPDRVDPGISPPPIHTLNIGGRDIAFEGVEGVYGTGSVFGQATFGDITTHRDGMDNNITVAQTNERGTPFLQVDWDRSMASTFGEVRIYTPLTGNTSLDTVLASQVWSDGRTANSSATHVTMRNLIPGKQYQVQMIAGADSRAPRGSTVERSLSHFALNDGMGNTVSEFGAYRDIDGDGVKHVSSAVGKFVASGDTQRVNILLAAGRNPGFSALILSTFPQQMTVTGGQTELAAGGGTLDLTSLSIHPAGVLAMRDNDLLIDYTGESPIAALVEAWNAGRLLADGDSAGLPTYLAIAEAADLGIAEFNGFNVDETAVVGKFTFVGDANLDGQVDALDYERVDLAIGNSGVLGTAQGDLNYDGAVDALDYEQIDLNIGNGVGSPLAVVVPEPAGVAMMSLVAIAAGRRVRR